MNIEKFIAGQFVYEAFNPHPIYIKEILSFTPDKSRIDIFDRYNLIVINHKGEEKEIMASPKSYKDYDALIEEHTKKIKTLTDRRNNILYSTAYKNK